MDIPEVHQYMNYLHDRFVIVPVDKASNNFGIVCKSFYLDVIKNELGISDDDNISGHYLAQIFTSKKVWTAYFIYVLKHGYPIFTNASNRYCLCLPSLRDHIAVSTRMTYARL